MNPPGSPKFKRSGLQDSESIRNDLEQDEPRHYQADHEEAEEEEAWLISYADLMTLLFGVFVMLFSTVEIDAAKQSQDYVKVRKEIAKFFGGSDVTDSVAKSVKKELKESPLIQDMILKTTADGLEISFVNRSFFDSGSTELSPAATDALKAMTSVLLKIPGNYMVQIEGHTDDDPISTPQIPSNWELSALRASAVLRKLEANGVPTPRLSATGFGSSRPILPNRDPQGNRIPANQAQNRRVVLKVVLKEKEPEAAPAAKTLIRNETVKN